MRHLEAEKAAGRQIFPAFAGLEAMNDKGKEIDMSKLLSILKTGSNLYSMQATWMWGSERRFGLVAGSIVWGKIELRIADEIWLDALFYIVTSRDLVLTRVLLRKDVYG
jgi:hypothetical protein